MRALHATLMTASHHPYRAASCHCNLSPPDSLLAGLTASRGFLFTWSAFRLGACLRLGIEVEGALALGVILVLVASGSAGRDL
jgi:hypothetical protein